MARTVRQIINQKHIMVRNVTSGEDIDVVLIDYKPDVIEVEFADKSHLNLYRDDDSPGTFSVIYEDTEYTCKL